MRHGTARKLSQSDDCASTQEDKSEKMLKPQRDRAQDWRNLQANGSASRRKSPSPLPNPIWLGKA
jgi:hypothetical protein